MHQRKESNLIRINQIKLKPDHTEKDLRNKVFELLKIQEKQCIDFEIVKKSIDARKKPDIIIQYCVDVKLIEEEQILKRIKNPNIGKAEPISYELKVSGNMKMQNPPVIIGSGPAGLFCAYELAKAGYQPILLERGDEVQKRKELVDLFWEQGILDTESNVSFGEGGAGTFSDGKLNTLVKDKFGRNHEVLKLFVEYGAPKEILYDSKPHIGTDILMEVVQNIRHAILQMGGEIRFRSKVTDFLIEQERIKAVCLEDGSRIPAEVVVLAIGHSARDTFQMLQKKQVKMEVKNFALGFRVEHPQTLINLDQYGEAYRKLPTANYKLTAQTEEGRGVYSFCMCPGGYVVNASTEQNKLAINGMSYSKRDGNNANSAIIISVETQDFPDKGALSALYFQQDLENKAFRLGEGNIPVQRFSDFYESVMGEPYEYQNSKLHKEEFMLLDALEPNTKGAYRYADLSGLLPEELNKAFVKAMLKFDRSLLGFAHGNVVVLGIESRTSSPVRILRDLEKESNIKGLYPCGEGAGYAGGIMSAAMDGLQIAEVIAAKYKSFE